MGHICIQTTSPTTYKTFQINKLHIQLTVPPAKISEKREFLRPWAPAVLFTNLHSIGSGYDKNFHISIMSRQHPRPHVMVNLMLFSITVSEILDRCQNLLDDPHTLVFNRF